MPKKKPCKPLAPLTREEAMERGITSYQKQVIGSLYDELGEATYNGWFHTNNFQPRRVKENGDLDFRINGGRYVPYEVRTRFPDQLEKAFQKKP